MALLIDPTREIKGVDTLVALALFGESNNHPYMLMRNMDYELALLSYHNMYGKSASTIQELMTPEIEADVLSVIQKLREYYQNLVNRLEQQEQRAAAYEQEIKQKHDRYEEQQRLRQAGKDFIKNNIVDYGGKTVAQIATELGISKAEVRRRKANGEL